MHKLTILIFHTNFIHTRRHHNFSQRRRRLNDSQHRLYRTLLTHSIDSVLCVVGCIFVWVPIDCPFVLNSPYKGAVKLGTRHTLSNTTKSHSAVSLSRHDTCRPAKHYTYIKHKVYCLWCTPIETLSYAISPMNHQTGC